MIYSQLIRLNHFQLFLKKNYDYVDKHVYSANGAMLIRDLCTKLDSRDFIFFSIVEINEMVILLCTYNMNNA